MKKFLALLVVAVLALASIAVAETENYEVTLILKDNTSAGWRYLAAAAVATGEEIGVTVTENSPLETQDADQQYNAVLDAIEREVDAIVIAPVDSAGIVPAIETAVEAGIPVFTTNTQAFVENEDDIVTFVGVGNEQGGYDIAKYMFSQFPDDEEINLIIVDGNRTGQTTLDRIAGIERAIAEDERVNLLDSQEGMFSRAQAQEIWRTSWSSTTTSTWSSASMTKWPSAPTTPSSPPAARMRCSSPASTARPKACRPYSTARSPLL